MPSRFDGAVALYLLLPILVIAGVSLNAKKVLFFPPQGVSLRWYREFFTQADWSAPALPTAVVALRPSP